MAAWLELFRWRDAVDLLIVAAIIYRVFVMFRGTRATQLLAGVGLLMGTTILARRLGLAGTGWILENLSSFWLIALIVLFQPELRRALAQIGQAGLLRGIFGTTRAARTHAVDDVSKATALLASRRVGALIVFERKNGLAHYAELGVAVDGLVSAELLGSIFLPYSPLHDGAVIIRGTRIVAAGCFLPLSRNMQLGRSLGTRHRAALGITEETDAVALVASEETGAISLAAEGQIEPSVSGEALRRRLADLLRVGEAAGRPPFYGALRRRLFGETVPRLTRESSRTAPTRIAPE
jgi:diadenylate cyclase